MHSSPHNYRSYGVTTAYCCVPCMLPNKSNARTSFPQIKTHPVYIFTVKNHRVQFDVALNSLFAYAKHSAQEQRTLGCMWGTTPTRRQLKNTGTTIKTEQNLLIFIICDLLRIREDHIPIGGWSRTSLITQFVKRMQLHCRRIAWYHAEWESAIIFGRRAPCPRPARCYYSYDCVQEANRQQLRHSLQIYTPSGFQNRHITQYNINHICI